MSRDKYCLLAMLFFEDRSVESKILFVGTKKQCKELQDNMPAINYTGDKKILEARSLILNESQMRNKYD